MTKKNLCTEHRTDRFESAEKYKCNSRMARTYRTYNCEF